MPDPDPPKDGLEEIMAVDEAAIRDDGFSARVMGRVGQARTWRASAIYGAGMAGAGFAVGGILELSPHLPKVRPMVDTAANTISAAGLNGAWHGASDGMQLAVVAVIAGIIFLLAAVAAQSR